MKEGECEGGREGGMVSDRVLAGLEVKTDDRFDDP